MARIAVVFGTRPEAIKMIPVVRELRRRGTFRTTVLTTGQHRHLLDQVFSTFGEKPDLDLDLMRPGQSLADITAGVILGISTALDTLRPDLVLVHGDTTTAMAAAVAAFYKRVRIGHVEAGLRSFDLDRPWPEEFNRVAIDAIAHLAFAPTAAAGSNLQAEYNRRAKIFITGNTGIDALLFVSAMIDRGGEQIDALARRYGDLGNRRRLVLATAHRREAFGEGFERICDGLASVAARGDVDLVYPVHLNPEVGAIVRRRLAGIADIHLVDPVEYLDMVYLMKRSHLILTDSGGLQEEGPALGKPVLVMRDVTERPEAVATGAVRLVGTDAVVIRREVDRLLDDAAHYRERSRPVFPYGDGSAAGRICDAIEQELSP